MKDQHGGEIYTAKEQQCTNQVLDFSANINPFGVPQSVQRAIIEEMEQLVHYPDPQCRKLRQALGRFHQIPTEWIVCGNGGADVLFRMIRVVSPKHALIPSPTFSEYAKALKEQRCHVTEWHMPYPFALTEEILHEIDSGIYDFLVLCNPNNPTGTPIASALLREILVRAASRQIFVLLDECFCDMILDAEATMVSLLHQYPRMFLLKSLTKLYAIPGLRIGYGLCSDSSLVEATRTTGQPWPVNVLASAAGCAAVQDAVYREQFFSWLQEERQFLFAELQTLGMITWKPSANYIFFRAPGWGHLDQLLLQHQILLRHCENYTGLHGEYYRAAVRLREENRKLLDALYQVMQKGEKCKWQNRS